MINSGHSRARATNITQAGASGCGLPAVRHQDQPAKRQPTTRYETTKSSAPRIAALTESRIGSTAYYLETANPPLGWRQMPYVGEDLPPSPFPCRVDPGLRSCMLSA